MPPKKKRTYKCAKTHKSITIELKKEIIAKYENKMSITEISKQYNMPKSTICTILKNKEVIKASNVAKGVTVLTKQRLKVLEEIEKMLLIWINDKQLSGEDLGERIICAKARQLYKQLLENRPSTSEQHKDFKASRGWFENFRRRSGFYKDFSHWDVKSSNAVAAHEFVNEFAEFVKNENYVSQQVFKGDATGLFWKRMPRRNFITLEEMSQTVHRSMKDRLRLLLCANANGDCKIKPLLVYHTDNPPIFKSNNVLKGELPVMWGANSKATMTQTLFMDWLREVFAPTVKKYLEDKKLPLRCLLLMDSAPADLPGLEEDLDIEYEFIRVIFLPPNTTPLLQPMDRQVVSSFIKLYTKGLFFRCFQATCNSELTLKEFWKLNFDILQGINIINEAWNEVSCNTLQSGWKKIWPSFDVEVDVDESEKQAVAKIVEDIVFIGKSMGLGVNESDVEKLLEDHREELTIKELRDLQSEQMGVLQDDNSLDEDGQDITTTNLMEICSKWNDVQRFIENHHPNKVLANKAIKVLNENAMSHFRNLLQQ